MNAVWEIEFLGIITNYLKMCLSLPQQKMLKIQSQCHDIHAKGQVFRSSCLNNSVSFASSDGFLISLGAVNKSIESNSVLSSDCIPQQQFKERTSVVDPKSKFSMGVT